MSEFSAGRQRSSLYGYSALPAVSRDPERQRWLNEHVNFPPATPEFTSLEPRAHRRASKKVLRAAERIVRREAHAAKVEAMMPIVRTDTGTLGVTFGPGVQWVWTQHPAEGSRSSISGLEPEVRNERAGKRAVRAANRIVRDAAQRVEQEIAADYRFVGQEIDAVLPAVNMQKPEQVQLPPESGTNLL